MADLRFDNRVALVTGGGRGLGRAHALLLASRGARVVVNDLGGETDGTGALDAPARAVVEEIRAAGGEAVADTHSVAERAGGEAMVRAALDAFGRLDIVVHNAGAGRGAEATIGVHLLGAFNVMRAAWPVLRERRYGRVVLTASSAGLFGVAIEAEREVDAVAYGAAKMGLVGLAHNLAGIGVHHNIRVNAIAPVAYTRMTQPMPDLRDFPATVAWLADHCDPSLVSPLVAWLCHEDCPVSHEVYSAGCGRVARVFVAETPGYFKPELTPEDVRDNFEQIRREDGYFVFSDAHEEMAVYREVAGSG